jgi:hypothetical protein
MSIFASLLALGIAAMLLPASVTINPLHLMRDLSQQVPIDMAWL